MVGNMFALAKIHRISMACVVVAGLAACDENGEFSLGAPQPAEAEQLAPANAPNQVFQEERDIERPDIFEVSDSGLWDGRPSLGGVWVAHPDAQDPERVLIRNTENGRSIIGALFRRERENPGPLLQVSSDAADELGILPGAPTSLAVVALRREEVEVIVPEAETNPVVASLDAPVNVEAEPLDAAPEEAAPVAAAAMAADTQVELPPALEAATAAVEASTAAAAAAITATAVVATEAEEAAPEPADTIDVSAVISAPLAPADGPVAQVGVYSNEANANAAVAQITQAGIAANISSEQMGGQTVWRVTAGPLVDETVVAQLRELGFVDAFIADDE